MLENATAPHHVTLDLLLARLLEACSEAPLALLRGVNTTPALRLGLVLPELLAARLLRACSVAPPALLLGVRTTLLRRDMAQGPALGMQCSDAPCSQKGCVIHIVSVTGRDQTEHNENMNEINL